MPCTEKRARLMLERGRARVVRMYPFTIRLVDRVVEESELQPIRLGIDPGSKTTGLALARETENVNNNIGGVKVTRHALFLAELEHRGDLIRDRLKQRTGHRRFRRSKLRYRPARFLNRANARQKGRLMPSLMHRVNSTLSWVNKLRALAPITEITQELVKFDTQKMQNPEISGIEYQQGTLFGYEVKEYLLEKWRRFCVYCSTTNVPLEIEHIVPLSNGGSNRISNLTLACHSCNQKKSNRDIREFLSDKPELIKQILLKTKISLKDAVVVNSTRWKLFESLKSIGLPVFTSSGGRTKWNRSQLSIPKTHALDALCVGNIDAITEWKIPSLKIKAMGRGSYKRTRLNKYGFPRGYLTKKKKHYGFQTGDLVKAIIEKGKNIGTHIGRVAIRASGKFDIQVHANIRQGISYQYCQIIQRSDGYNYNLMKI